MPEQGGDQPDHGQHQQEPQRKVARKRSGDQQGMDGCPQQGFPSARTGQEQPDRIHGPADQGKEQIRDKQFLPDDVPFLQERDVLRKTAALEEKPGDEEGKDSLEERIGLQASQSTPLHDVSEHHKYDEEAGDGIQMILSFRFHYSR